ncbi:MAG: C39 family peptidase [Chloroflexota bacterium]
MPNNLLSVSHLQQRNQSDCLPICTQMVAGYLGKNLSYRRLTRLLGTRRFGTPFRNISRLDSVGLSVAIEHLPASEMPPYLSSGIPIIASVDTSPLKYWSQSVDHVIVVIGLDDTHIYANDPAFADGGYPIPLTQFELAQLRFDLLCAILTLPN